MQTDIKALEAKVDGVIQIVTEIKKYILGNGQPGLLDRTKCIEVTLDNHLADYRELLVVQSASREAGERKLSEAAATFQTKLDDATEVFQTKFKKMEDEKKEIETKKTEKKDKFSWLVITIILTNLGGIVFQFFFLERIVKQVILK